MSLTVDEIFSILFYSFCEVFSGGGFYYLPQFSHKGFSHCTAQSSAKGFISSPYQTGKELPLAFLSNA